MPQNKAKVSISRHRRHGLRRVHVGAEGDVGGESDLAEFFGVRGGLEEVEDAVEFNALAGVAVVQGAFTDRRIREHGDGGGGDPVFLRVVVGMANFPGGDEHDVVRVIGK